MTCMTSRWQHYTCQVPKKGCDSVSDCCRLSFPSSHALPLLPPLSQISDPREGASKCFVHLLSAFVLLCALALLFALLFLRPYSPTLHLRSASLTSSSPSFNLTLAAHLALHNPNFGRFTFQNSTATLLYGDATVGEGRLGEGAAKARETLGVNVTVEATSNGSLLDANSLSSDLESGFLRLWSYSLVSGEVQLLDLVSKRKSIEMNCSFTLHLQTRQVHDLLCS